MYWEERGQRRYLYRSIRVGKQVLRQYLGHGPEAEALAAEDRRRRDAEQAHAAALRATLEAWQEAGRPADALNTLTLTLAQALLSAAGYHRPQRGPWRKCRHVGNPKPEASGQSPG